MTDHDDDAIEPVPPTEDGSMGIASTSVTIQKASVSPSVEQFLSYGAPSDDVRGEDLLPPGKVAHDEPDYYIEGAFMVGRPDPEWRFPIFDTYPSPMEESFAREALAELTPHEQTELPSSRSRLYRVTVWEMPPS